jgi:hypothetical protein
MTFTRLALVAALLTTMVAATGCYYSGGYSYGYVAAGPPLPRRVYYAPRPGYVYIDGRWDWRGNDWFWIDGYWAPERPGFIYAQGYWDYNRHIYVNGSWTPYRAGYVYRGGYYTPRGGSYYYNPGTYVRDHRAGGTYSAPARSYRQYNGGGTRVRDHRR